MNHTEGRRETPLPRRARPVVLLIAGVLAALTAAAAVNARRAHGRPFAGLFTDAHGSYSAVWWPSWGSQKLPVHFPDRLIAIDGQPLPPPPGRFELPAHRLGARFAALGAAGRRDVATTWQRRDGSVITVVRPLMEMGAD